jgi:hypothetical protein
MPMPNRVIKRVNTISAREKQGQEFRFLNRQKEPYDWTDEVPEDDPEFQGLLKEPAQYSDILAKLPEVELESKLEDDQVGTDEPEPDFAALAAAALANAGIDPQDRLHSAQAANDAPPPEPALIEAYADKIVYEITFDLPIAGLIGPAIIPDYNMEPAAHNGDDNHNLAMETVDLLTNDTHQAPRRCPSQSCRSVIKNKPYDS